MTSDARVLHQILTNISRRVEISQIDQIETYQDKIRLCFMLSNNNQGAILMIFVRNHKHHYQMQAAINHQMIKCTSIASVYRLLLEQSSRCILASTTARSPSINRQMFINFTFFTISSLYFRITHFLQRPPRHFFCFLFFLAFS